MHGRVHASSTHLEILYVTSQAEDMKAGPLNWDTWQYTCHKCVAHLLDWVAEWTHDPREQS